MAITSVEGKHGNEFIFHGPSVAGEAAKLFVNCHETRRS
jgi:hypothetical protein